MYLSSKGSPHHEAAQKGTKPSTMNTSNASRIHSQEITPKIRSAALVGQAVLNLRRQACDEISGFRYNRLVNLASALEATLPAIEALEARS